MQTIRAKTTFSLFKNLRKASNPLTFPKNKSFAKFQSLSQVPLRSYVFKPKKSEATRIHPEAEVQFDSEGRAIEGTDSQDIFDFDDKFNLREINDPKKILDIAKQANYGYPINDLIYFLRRIVHLNEKRNLKISIHNTPELHNFIKAIKKQLKTGLEDEKFPVIGSYAWCFWKLGVKGDNELWKLLGDYIKDDHYSPLLKEVTFGIEGFSMLEGIVDREYIEKVYENLERNCLLTLWEVDMTYYQRIAKGLVHMERYTPILFKKLENHIMNNFSMDYSLNQMTDILFAFAQSGNGSKEFYNAVQFVIYKGHMWNRMAPFRMLWKETPNHGAFIGKLIYTYHFAKEKHPDMKFEPDFRAHVYQLAVNDKAKYNLEDLTTVIEHIEVFQFEDSKVVYEILDNRVFEITENMYADDMIRFLDAKVRRDYDGDYSKLPEKYVKFFDDYLLKNFDSQDPNRLHYYLAESEIRGLVLGKKELVEKMLEDMGKKLINYDLEKVCYMSWFTSQYDFMIEDKKEIFKPTLSLFKDYIKIYKSSAQGERLLESKYYKILDVLKDETPKKVEGSN